APFRGVTTTSLEDVSRYLNDPPEIQMSKLLNEPVYTDYSINKDKEKARKTLLKNVIQKKNDWKNVVQQRLEDHEQRLNALSQLKEKLYDMMFESGSSISHQAHQELYDALGKSIIVEKLEARYGTSSFSQKKRSHDDQDPPKNYEGENKKRRHKDISGPSS
ncbi:hypothetical protein Tco_1251783, partial [Tanacetum coccineum]